MELLAVGIALVFLVGPLVLAIAVKVLWSRLEDARRELRDLKERTQVLEARSRALARNEMPAAREPVAAPPIAAPLPSARPPVPRPSPPLISHPTSTEPDLVGDLIGRARAWLVGGNTVVRVGVVVLLFGVAFFLNFVVDRGWLPVEFRLALAALGGLALTATGWWLRARRRDYALVLQGGGIGVVYLTVFAAVDLYSIVPAGPGLALMVVLVALSSALALLQDARSLAVFATLAGFLAPVIVSSGGSHVGLFWYYAALNLGIVTIARYKSWRSLNLLGFVFTFIISAAWGARYYEPPYFSTTEPFLIAFFLLYVAVPVLFATRQTTREDRYMDGSLLFGVPLVAFGLQAGLVRNFEYGLAFSALALGLFYVGLATALWRRLAERARLLIEAFLALGVGFGTLTIPLAVDGRWTGSAWALEGAGLVWIGVRQNRRLATASGLLLQLLAGGAFLTAADLPVSDTPILNSIYIGALLVSLSGFFCGWYVHRRQSDVDPAFHQIPGLMLIWSLFWWGRSGLHEIRIFVSQPDLLAACLVFAASSALALVSLSKRLSWSQAAMPVRLLLPVMIGIAALTFMDGHTHPLVRWDGLAWGIALAAHYWIQRRVEREWPNRMPEHWHAGMMWLVLFLVSWETAWAVGMVVDASTVWRDVAWVLLPGIALVAVPRLARMSWWPFAQFGNSLVAALAPVAVVVVLWILLATINRGDPAPLSYVPFLNPVELAQCLSLVALLGLPFTALASLSARDRWLLATVLAFVILNGVIARAIHFWGGVMFNPVALWDSARYQTAISIAWTGAAMAAMLAARVMTQRTIWISGATLLLVVVVKLFVVDLAGVGTVARIVSFLVVGLLILLVGYLSPLPPRPHEETQS